VNHLDVMGPGPDDVARALAGTTPVGGKLYTSERDRLAILKEAAEDRKSELVAVGSLEEEMGEQEATETLASFRYTEHSDNVALALRVCTDLGVEPEVALGGMTQAAPDPGATIERRLGFFGRDIVFVNERPFELVERVLDSAIFTFLQTVSAETINANYEPVLRAN